MNLKFLLAQHTDVTTLVNLINSAYRGETSKLGWTSEADLLAGLRTDADEISRLLYDDKSMILKCRQADQLLGCVLLQAVADKAQISMLSVSPLAQGRGIGKKLLAYAEAKAQESWKIKHMQMFVISCRHELIAYYQRRGYQRTGCLQDFPIQPELWQPKVSGLMLELLEKHAGPSF